MCSGVKRGWNSGGRRCGSGRLEVEARGGVWGEGTHPIRRRVWERGLAPPQKNFFQLKRHVLVHSKRQDFVRVLAREMLNFNLKW